MITTVCTDCESSENPTCSGCGAAVDVDALLDTARSESRQSTAEAIAHQLAVKVCGPLCEHPSCSTYRFAARIAREHGIPRPRIPEQGGDPT